MKNETKIHKDLYWTPVELAMRLNLPVETLRAWRARGIGPPFRRIGPRLIRYRREDVEAWEAQGGA